MKEISCVVDAKVAVELFGVLFQLPSLTTINIVSTVYLEKRYWLLVTDLSSVPHRHLEKFRFWTSWIGYTQKNSKHRWVYAPEAPLNDVAEFERNIIAFFDSDSDVPGLKNSDVIQSMSIGDYSWLLARLKLSKEFVANLFTKHKNCHHFEIYHLSSTPKINKVIDEIGRQFERHRIDPNHE